MIVSLYVLFEFLSIIFCLHYLYGEKVKFDVKTVGVIVIDLLLMQFIYYGKLSQMWSVLIYPAIIIYCGLKFGFNLKEIVVNNILYLVIIGFLQLGVVFILNIVFEVESVTRIQALVVNIFIFLTVIGILKRCNLNILSRYLQDKEVIMKIALGGSIVVMLFSLLKHKQNDGFDLLSCISLLASSALICLITAGMGKYKLKMKEAETELKMYKLYEDSFLSLIDNIRSRQHEFGNHISAIYSQHYLYETYEDLVNAQKEYCNDLVKENRYNKLILTGNSMIVGFLYGKFIEAEKYNIEVSYTVNVKNLDCGIPNYKMIELLGNLLNNAIEELRLTKEGNRLLVHMQETGDKIEIEVGNECEEIQYDKIQQFFEKGYSEKGKHRGYGLYNVKRICDIYKMNIECSNKEMAGRNFLIFKIVKYKKPFVE